MFGYNDLVAESYNGMVPYIDSQVPLKEFPFYDQLSEYEKEMYQSTLDDLIRERKAHPDIPIHLDTMEKDWD